MPIVKFINEKKEVEVADGAYLRDEAIKAGVNLNCGVNGWGENLNKYVNCGGKGMCGTCRVLIAKGVENTNKVTRREWLHFKTPVPLSPDPAVKFAVIGHEEKMRLACLTRVFGDIEVESGPELNLFGDNFFS